MPRHRFPRLTGAAFAAALCLPGIFAPARAQTMDFERQRARAMLNIIKDDIKKNYYDPNFRGIDIEARFKKADEDIKAAGALRQINTIIAQTLLDFRDSHTFFIPPSRYYRTEYGWRMQIIGDKCYVVAVKPGSDAAGKGLKEGDLLVSVNGYSPTRDSLWILSYYYNTLAPQQRMQLVVQSPDGSLRPMEVMAKVTEGKKLFRFEDYYSIIRDYETDAQLNRHVSYELDGGVFLWKMPQFDMEKEDVDKMMSRVKKHKALILDLRGNGGGYEVTMLRLLGHLFDRDINVGDLKSRRETKPVLAKTRGADNFKGKVVVLVDSRSGSAAEVVARVVQLEKRGTVVGDRSAGAVMRSKFYGHTHGQEIVVAYGASVTDSDLIMTDGKSLEGAGVVPDTVMLPTAADLSGRRDPVLAHAASLVGLELGAEKAAALFPVEWR